MNLFKFIEVDKDFYWYHFPAPKGSNLGSSVFMITSGTECILIDSAHTDQFKLVQKDILKRGLTIQKLIVTHYHPYHTGGIYVVDDVVGSSSAGETLQMFYDDFQHLMPDTPIDKETTLQFGNHTILLENNIGHSLCTLLITLNDKYIFVGDDIITDNDGNLLMPFVAETLGEHISGVKRISEVCEGKIIVPSHGIILRDSDKIKHHISAILTYLNYVLNDNTKTYAEFNRETGIDLLNHGWHKSNMERD